jgi:hypothetical protein
LLTTALALDVVRRGGRQVPGRRMRRSAWLVVARFGSGLGLRLRRQMPRRRMRRSAGLVIVGFRPELIPDQGGRV